MATQVTLNSGSVDSAGSLALKTNGTTTAVTINTSQGVEFNAGTAAAPSITTTGDTNTGIFFPAADTIAFSEGGVESMRIDASGNLMVGTTTANGKLAVYQSTSGDGTISVGNAQDVYTCNVGKQGSSAYGATSAGDAFLYTSTKNISIMADGGSSVIKFSAGGNTERARIDSSGNLLVGTTSGTGSRMDVEAADEVVSFNRSAATDGVVQRWKKAGSTIGYVSTNTYSLPSDERVKTNIVNIGYGLDFINSLRPVQYNTIFQDPENAAQKNFGLIAQEVEQALANIGKSVDDVTFLEKFVPENDTESRYGLGYQNLVPVLIKAIQELKALVDTQASTITALQADVEALKGTA